MNDFFYVILVLIMKTHHPASELPRNSYALAALFLVGAKYTANHALQKVPYPTQVVGKGEMSHDYKHKLDKNLDSDL